MPNAASAPIQAPLPAPPARTAFSTLARAIIFAQAIIAFGALAFTREVQPIVMAIFFGGWLAGWLIGGPPRWARPWMGNIITVILVGALGFAVVVRRIEFFSGVLSLLLFLVLSKCILLRTSKDYIQAQVLSFFVVVSTSVITVSFHFIVFYFLYLFAAVFGLIYYNLALQAERGAAHLYLMEGEAARRKLRMPRRLLWWGSVAFMCVVAMSLAVFFLIPHISTESLDAPLARRTPSTEKLSGFSEEVELGEFKQITPDSTVVMRVELTWPSGRIAQRPSTLRMRATALEYYDEKRWRRSPVRPEVRIDTARTFNFSIDSAQRGVSAKLKVYQDPDVTLRVFTAPWPMTIEFQGEQRVRNDPGTGALQVIAVGASRDNVYTNPFVYQLTTNLVEEAEPLIPNLIRAREKERTARARAMTFVHGDPAAAEAFWKGLRENPAESGSLPWIHAGTPPQLEAEERLINTELPLTELSRRVRELAAKASPGPTPEETVLQLLSYFRREFTYTLTPGTPPGMHPIDAFLFNTKRGHCEYFATAMVLMLRARGIPAHLVNGFITSEWSELAQVYKVKQSDAHTWVEVWLDGVGWLTVDPTPPGSMGRGAYGGMQVEWWEKWNDYLRLQWQRYVIDFTAERQVSMFDELKKKPGVGALLKIVDRFRTWADPRRANEPEERPNTPQARVAYFVRWVRDLAIFFGLCFLMVRGGMKLWSIRGRRKNSPGSAIDYYRLLAVRLKRLGFDRARGQTPEEFLRAAARQVSGGEGLEWLVGLYYRHRFGGEAATAAERSRALEIIEGLKPLEEGARV